MEMVEVTSGCMDTTGCAGAAAGGGAEDRSCGFEDERRRLAGAAKGEFCKAGGTVARDGVLARD